MAKFIDMTGKKIGRLFVLKRADNRISSLKNITYWICKCDCGNIIETQGKALRANIENGCYGTRSCGCLAREKASKTATLILSKYRGNTFKTHGKSKSPEYTTWSCIKSRCLNKKNQAYKWYGARGIIICEEWKKSFEQFYKDMGPRPSKLYSIDRIDNNKGYYKENCRWVTRDIQQSNKRSNHMITYKGITKNLQFWANLYNIKFNTIISKLNRGFKIEDILIHK